MAQATIGNSEFDRDTAVTPREPGVHDAELSSAWTIIHAVNGGYLLAMAGRALGEVLPHSDPFTVTAHYLTASRPGPARIRTEVVRTGRTLSTGQASLTQLDENGAEVERLRVVAGYGDLGALPDDVRTTAKPPAMPPFEECLGARHADDEVGALLGATEIAGRLDVRLDPATAGWARGKPSGNGEMRAWFRLADGRDADPLSLLLAVDALPPTAFEMGISGWVPTVELTAHIRSRPAPGPLRVAITTRNLAGGFLEEDAEVWDSRDRLVAQSRQLARAQLG
ncbi:MULTISPECIES: thioesterase family protein [Streptomyces]|uniref:Thioesterase family protein n=2 Tax=Streptomyces TaxID=1883 RepID=A0A3M8FBW2_9ACTN|nr:MULTISPECIES: thioesterase family protein [Streptomyces]KNE81883.1 TesB-like acyl-CoA thioesterase 3 [Streptomyces fradiae]OFA61442.1 TesB-like acyl-CoA thioesterase 3 [Streptomyces fradiae]PQM24409.1 thioesterase family protein [Streptomyces xinghaiensis]RKM98077.1 thioesterase family protein [Streptomyces xinghaiensis]RNC75228.1 thioesterase family protein [Streptomyces xinghaiensis]